MNLEREKLERVDRKLLARLGQDETYQMVRVPVTPATWSTWKRCCEDSGTSMGRAIVALIERELGMLDDDNTDRQHRSAGDLQEQLAGRVEELNARKEVLDVRDVPSRLSKIRSLPRPGDWIPGRPNYGPSNTAWRPDRGSPFNPGQPSPKLVVTSDAHVAQAASTSNATVDEVGCANARKNRHRRRAPKPVHVDCPQSCHAAWDATR